MEQRPRRKDYCSLSAQGTRDEVIGASKSYFKLRKKGEEKARPPGFRRKKTLSNLRYYEGYGFEIKIDQLYLRFGRSWGDDVKGIEGKIQSKIDVKFTKVINGFIIYDKKLGLQAHLVVETEDLSHWVTK